MNQTFIIPENVKLNCILLTIIHRQQFKIKIILKIQLSKFCFYQCKVQMTCYKLKKKPKNKKQKTVVNQTSQDIRGQRLSNPIHNK